MLHIFKKCPQFRARVCDAPVKSCRASSKPIVTANAVESWIQSRVLKLPADQVCGNLLASVEREDQLSVLFVHCLLLGTAPLLVLDPVDELVDDRGP